MAGPFPACLVPVVITGTTQNFQLRPDRYYSRVPVDIWRRFKVALSPLPPNEARLALGEDMTGCLGICTADLRVHESILCNHTMLVSREITPTLGLITLVDSKLVYDFGTGKVFEPPEEFLKINQEMENRQVEITPEWERFENQPPGLPDDHRPGHSDTHRHDLSRHGSGDGHSHVERRTSYEDTRRLKRSRDRSHSPEFRKSRRSRDRSPGQSRRSRDCSPGHRLSQRSRDRSPEYSDDRRPGYSGDRRVFSDDSRSDNRRSDNRNRRSRFNEPKTDRSEHRFQNEALPGNHNFNDRMPESDLRVGQGPPTTIPLRYPEDLETPISPGFPNVQGYPGAPNPGYPGAPNPGYPGGQNPIYLEPNPQMLMEDSNPVPKPGLMREVFDDLQRFILMQSQRITNDPLSFPQGPMNLGLPNFAVQSKQNFNPGQVTQGNAPQTNQPKQGKKEKRKRAHCTICSKWGHDTSSCWKIGRTFKGTRKAPKGKESEVLFTAGSSKSAPWDSWVAGN